MGSGGFGARAGAAAAATDAADVGPCNEHMSWLRLAVVVMVARVVTGSEAQMEFPRRWGQRPGSYVGLPGGPWIETAQNVEVRGNRLCASLRRADGVWASDCVSWEAGQQFENDGGSFRLHIDSTLPGGTWILSAKDVVRQGNLLRAQLRREDLSWAPAHAIVQEHEYFENVDGRFRIMNQYCNSLPQCLHGFVHLPNASNITCASRNCTAEQDTATCCELAMSCLNVTTCGWGYIADPDGYCPATVCDNVRDMERCCVRMGRCPDLGPVPGSGGPDIACLEGWTLKIDNTTGLPAQILCPSPECDRVRDRDLCCDPAESCATLVGTASCQFGFFLNVSAFCAGTSCEADRDVVAEICCDPAATCNATLCTHGYVARQNIDRLSCAGENCTIERDRDTCCAPADPCGSISCGTGYMTLPDTFCSGEVCDMAVDFDHCCYDLSLCATLNITSCPLGYYLNASAHCAGLECDVDRDLMICCQTADSCNSLPCPYGYNRKVDFGSRYCDGATCLLSRDRDRCCDVAAPCPTISCPYGYVLGFNASMTYCLGTVCESLRDRDICCDAAMPCTELTCPHSYTPKLGTFYCDSVNCSVARDLHLCCDDAADCVELNCTENYAYNSVTKPDTYCFGTSCVLSRDGYHCCAVGTALQFYRFSPSLLRDPVAAESRVQFGEIVLHYYDETLSFANARASSPGGSPPGEEPAMAIDGIPSTKWLDETTQPLTIDMKQVVPITGYSFITANDEPPRDPVSWVFEAALDGSVYVPLGTISGGYTDVPLTRLTQTPEFPINIPCLAPTHVPGLSCLQGNLIGHGGICFARCVGVLGFVAFMTCDQGTLDPAPATINCADLR